MEELNLKKKKVSTHKIRRILPLYLKSKKLIFALIICFVLGGILGIFGPICSANSLANLANENFDVAKKFIFYTAIITFFRILLDFLVQILYVRINSKTKSELTKMVIESIGKTKMKKLDTIKIGTLTERLSGDVRSISDSYLDMVNLIFDIITNIVLLCYIAYLNIFIFIVLLVYVILLYFLCVIRSRVWIRGRKITKKANDDAKSAYYQQIIGIRDIKLLNIKENITNYGNKKFDEALKLEINIDDKRNLLRRLQRLLATIFEFFFFLMGIFMINKEFILLSGFLVIYNYYGKVEGLVNYLSSFKEFKADGEISATRIFEIIDEYEKDSFGNDTLQNFSGKISLKNINFSYKDDIPILKNLSMDFEPNKTTAIVGKSGSGKTTILNLISKLYDTTDGEILFDDKEIKSLTEDSIRSNIGEISQSPYIFNSTIRQNLLFVKPNATEEEMVQVLKQAQIYDDIEKMENKLDTEIGENGIKISGGQKQRLAIARLLLKNNKVIVFDEATSALDNESQSKIVELLDELKVNKTIIIVAHRLSTIIGADKIYILDDGKILDCGTHKYLMNNCDEYKKLYELEEKNSNISEIHDN